MNPDITHLLNAATEKIGCKGALAAISINGVVSTFSAGSIKSADHDRSFYIYSITKIFIAAAVLKICETHGDFLDAPLHRFIPDAPVPSGITIRHLLNHTGGVSDYFSSREYQEAVANHPAEPWSPEKLMAVGLTETPLFEPGHGWSYSNPGYGFLKTVIESVSRKNFHDFLQEEILAGLELRDTRPFLAPDRERKLLEGETPGFAGDFRELYHPGWIMTGCLISTVSDIARFLDALFAGKIISRDSLEKMMETVDVLKTPPISSIPAYGLGLMHFREHPLGDAYGHGGGGPGYTTYAMHYPDLDGASFTLSLVMNKSLPQTPFDLADKIARFYLDYAERWPLYTQPV